MVQHTPLYAKHVQQGGKMVNFAGWSMPIHYGSQLQEHHAVRKTVGMFDVSHMAVVDVLGPGARDFLRHLLANDVDRLQSRGKALYSCMLNETGGVIDDLIAYFIDVHHYRLVLNASRVEEDLKWINEHISGYSVGMQRRQDLGMLAIQGPKYLEYMSKVLNPTQLDAISTISPFECVISDDWFVARTGYTGEDGFEIILPHQQLNQLWDGLIAEQCRPCGLGARDTLRLEAGLNLYGNDMDETTSPLESNLAWTIAWEPADRIFLGRGALLRQKEDGIKYKLVGLVLEDKGVLRPKQKVIVGDDNTGQTTSGTFSPTLERAIALARIPKDSETSCMVEIRGKLLKARIVKPPFVRKGKILVDIT